MIGGQSVRFFAALAFVMMATTGAHADEAADREAIKARVMDYFHGQGEASSERLNRAFAAEHATMVGVMKQDDGTESLRSWKDMGEILADWASREDPPGTERDGEIIEMEMVDGRLAVVLFRYTDRFYDALTLAKVNGQWKIVGKAFVRQ